MGELNPFKKPKINSIPVPKAPAPAPTSGNSAEEIAAAQKIELDKKRRQKGRASTILTKSNGVTGDDSAGVATKVLLGG